MGHQTLHVHKQLSLGCACAVSHHVVQYMGYCLCDSWDKYIPMEHLPKEIRKRFSKLMPKTIFKMPHFTDFMPHLKGVGNILPTEVQESFL